MSNAILMKAWAELTYHLTDQVDHLERQVLEQKKVNAELLHGLRDAAVEAENRVNTPRDELAEEIATLKKRLAEEMEGREKALDRGDQLLSKLERMQDDLEKANEIMTVASNRGSVETARQLEECKDLLDTVYPALRDVLWCALCWNDHNFSYSDLLKKAQSAASALGFQRGDDLSRINEIMARVDKALSK